MNRAKVISGLVLLILMGVSACAPVPEPTATEAQIATAAPELISLTSTSEETSTSAPESTVTQAIPVTGPLMMPPDSVPEAEKPVNDVESSAAGAPYGDSYRINRFERPFQQDMTYVPHLDITSFGLSEDDDWYYISISLNSNNPNNSLEINYGVEIDLDADGFGDYIVWARPPYATEWEANTIQVFEDGDRDTAGLSSRESDAVFAGNGYETLFFDGGSDQNPDPHLAWVRRQESEPATIQFALKKAWLGGFFLVGAIADGGLKDPSRFDYNDRFEEKEAGSPVRNNPSYPLRSLFAVDNTCWQAHGFANLAYQPKVCPAEALPTATRRPSSNTSSTEAPPTSSPLTNERPTNEPATNEPATIEPPTSNPPTSEPPTVEPPTVEPPTSEPPTVEPPPPTDPPEPACTPDFDPGECETYDPEICECT